MHPNAGQNIQMKGEDTCNREDGQIKIKIIFFPKILYFDGRGKGMDSINKFTKE